MALTGAHDGPPVSPGWSVASFMARVADDLVALGVPRIDGPALLGERAAVARLTRQGSISAGGSCRLVRAADAWMAVNLARPDDVALANAWLDDARLDVDDPWPRLAAAVASAPATDLVARAAPLGLAVSVLGEAATVTSARQDGEAHADATMNVGGAAAATVTSARQDGEAHADATMNTARALVVDLSALWAGPLCAHVLGLAGARVVKVESVERPDGARRGPAPFFDLLHHGHESVALAFGAPRGRDALRRLLDAADVVIEASRPRALEQLGIDARDSVDRGAVWVSITAYGRAAAPNRVGFGDDVAIAAGLHAGPPDAPVFCADAVSDPLAGIWAARAALVALRSQGGALVDVPMAAVTRLARGDERAAERAAERRAGEWFLDGAVVAPARTRSRVGAAAPLGSHTATVMGELGVARWD